MNPKRAAALLALASLPLLSCFAQTQEGDSPFKPFKPKRPRAEKALNRMAPEDRRGFERLLDMARGNPGAINIVRDLGEAVVNLEDLRKKKGDLPPKKYLQRQEELFGKIDVCLEDPRVRMAVLPEIGESLVRAGYSPEERLQMPRPPEGGPPPPRFPGPRDDRDRLADEIREALAPTEREKFDDLLDASRDRPKLAKGLMMTGERLLKLRHLRERESDMIPSEYRARQDELFQETQKSLLIVPPDLLLRVLEALGPSLDSAGYSIKDHLPSLLNPMGSSPQVVSQKPSMPLQPSMPPPSVPKEEQPKPAKKPLQVLLILLAAGCSALFLLRKRIAAWVVRQGAASLGTPLPAIGQTPTPPAVPEVTPSAAARIPTGYRIIRQIGQGGMGAVYEAEDVSLERRVAVKRMRDEIRQDPRELERFLKEARLVAKLHHPNIIEIHAIVEREGDLFLVFEFIDGMTLDQALAKHKRLNLQQSRAVLRQICAALGYAHDNGIIHRDLKPSNIMVTRQSLVKVMDFGVARQAKDVLNRLSMTNTVAGTPTYMAPESETGVVRKESDLYSLAICLYEMLTGARPFEGTGAGILMSKMSMHFEVPSRAAPDLPPSVDAFFASALHSDPEKRPRTAAEFAASFEAAAGFTTPPKLT